VEHLLEERPVDESRALQTKCKLREAKTQ
jgi:hypothetical protein